MSDVFAGKPFYLPPEATGDITITPIIETLQEKINPISSNWLNWTASMNFTTVIIPGTTSVDLYVDPTTFESHTSDQWIVQNDKKIENLKYIPAFYDSGFIKVVLTLSDTEDDEDHFNATCDMKVMFPNYPTWYEGGLAYDSQELKEFIKSNNQETMVGSVSPGFRDTFTFNMGTWSGMPPVEFKSVKDYNEAASVVATAIPITRGCLTTPVFKFTVTNHLSESISLGSVQIGFDYTYNDHGIFMDMVTTGNIQGELYEIRTLPKGADKNRSVTLKDKYPIYGVVQGFDLFPTCEIVKVWGWYDKYASTENVYYASCLPLFPCEGTFGTNFPTAIWKSDRLVSEYDFKRIAEKGRTNNDVCKVVTPQILAAGDYTGNDQYFRTVKVRCKDVNNNYNVSYDSKDTIFEITTAPATSAYIDDACTEADLLSNISKVTFFNVEKDFATVVELSLIHI